jgi:hypothetical protein
MRWEIKALDVLREAALPTRPHSVLGFERGSLLPLADGLDGSMVGLEPDGALLGSIFRCGACTPGGTRATGGPVKADAPDEIVRDIGAERPFDTGLSVGTGGLLRGRRTAGPIWR